MSRTARWVVTIALLEATLLGLYCLVEQRRTSQASAALGVEPPQRVDRPMPSLTVVHRDGRREPLGSWSRRTLVHVWATWCPPCRAELPGILGLSSRHEVAVVAVALDPSWDEVTRFVDGMDSSPVVLAAGEEFGPALAVQTLPVSFLVEAGGRIALRFDGTRDWTNDAFVRAAFEQAAP